MLGRGVDVRGGGGAVARIAAKTSSLGGEGSGSQGGIATDIIQELNVLLLEL